MSYKQKKDNVLRYLKKDPNILGPSADNFRLKYMQT